MTDRLDEVRLKEETLQHMQALMREAVRQGVQDLVNEKTIEQFWAGGMNMLQKQATQTAGRFVIGGLMGLVRKASVFLLLGLLAYWFGGWSALSTFFKTVFSSGGGS
jgi:hypothetical protein